MGDNAKTSQTVSFRLRGALLRRLGERADDAGSSLGECARDLVAAELQDEHRLELERKFELLHQELAKLRADISTTLEAVLLNVAKAPEEQVRQFVREKLRG